MVEAVQLRFYGRRFMESDRFQEGLQRFTVIARARIRDFDSDGIGSQGLETENALVAYRA